MKSVQMVYIFDAKHIKYLQSKPGETIESLCTECQKSESHRIPKKKKKTKKRKKSFEKKNNPCLDDHCSVSDEESAEVANVTMQYAL